MARPKLEDRVGGLEVDMKDIKGVLDQLYEILSVDKYTEPTFQQTELNKCDNIIAEAALKGYSAEIRDTDKSQELVDILKGIKGPALMGGKINGKELSKEEIIQSIGKPGKEAPVEVEELNELDTLLFKTGPEMLMKIAEGDITLAAEMADWLNKEDTAKDFILLWFAVNDEVRKKLLYAIFVRNVNISGNRLGLFLNSLPPEDVNDVRTAYQKLIAENNK